jgi:branched-chain amino acid transport system substrate-binding protein
MPITVGCCLSLTGPFALQGQQAEQGLRLWAEDVNATGGLLVCDRQAAQPVVFVVRDDHGRATQAAQLTEELIVDERVDLLVGPYGSATTLAAARVAEAHRKVLWNHGGASDALVRSGFHYVVNVLSPASRYLAGILDLARATRPELRRIFLVSASSGTFAPAVIDGAEAYARQHRFIIAGKALSPGGDDLAPIVTAIRAARPDILLAAGRLEADVALAKALHAASIAMPIVGLVAAGVAEFGAQLGAAANGIFGPSQWESGTVTRPDIGPTSEEFAQRFRAHYGSAPEYPAAQAYAAALIAQRCLDLAGTLRDEALRAAANTLDTRTLYGEFRLDPASGQQIGHALVIVRWQNGTKRVVWPPASVGD